MIKMLNKKRNKKGFTLVELVVVIAILGILASLAIPRLTSTRANAAMKTAVADSRTIASAVSMYLADGGTIVDVNKPLISDLSDYLTNATELNEKYTITYTGKSGEIEKITKKTVITVDGLDVSVWKPGSDELVAP